MELSEGEREKEALERHARLSKLFKEDRLGFERDRKRMIDEIINSEEDEEKRNGLVAKSLAIGCHRKSCTCLTHPGCLKCRIQGEKSGL